MLGTLHTLIEVKILEFSCKVSGKSTGPCPNCGGQAVKLMKCGYACGYVFCGSCAIYKPVEQRKIGLDAKFINCPGCRRELKLPR